MDLTKKRKLEDNQLIPDAAVPQLTADDARSLLSSFTHDQLLSIAATAALHHPDVLSAVRSLADPDPAQRKLFVRGLGWDTTTDKLRSVFSLYGDIDEAVVILDKATAKSKGYGFVTMKHVDGALLALKDPSKNIDGRMTVTQLAAAGIQGGPVAGSLPSGGGYDVSNRKIYVANVPYDMAGDRLLAHFSSYGEVEEGPLGYDKATGKSRGYALFVYKTVEAARASLVDPIKTVDGHQLNCKLANEGKRGKPEVGPGVAAQGPGEAHGNNGLGMQQHPNSVMPGPVGGGHYGGPTGPGGHYGGYSGGPQLGHHHPMNSSMGGGGGPGLSSVGSQAPSSMGVSGGGGYGSGLGGPYGGSNFGGPGSTGYGGGAGGLGSGGGGLVGSGGGYGGSGGGMVGSAGGFGGPGGGIVGNAAGLGGAGGGLGGSAGSLGGVGSGLGRGSSLYGGLPASSVGFPSGGYPESVHYSLSASGYGSQHNHPAGTSPAARVPPGGMYQGGNPYY